MDSVSAIAVKQLRIKMHAKKRHRVCTEEKTLIKKKRREGHTSNIVLEII